MNHIGDVNKLVSDTPRTDAELEFDPTSVDEVLDWSHQLERELNEANDRIKRLEEAGDEMEKYCHDYYSSNRWFKAKEAKP